MVWGNAVTSLFGMRISGFLTPVVANTVFASLNNLGIHVQKQLTVDVCIPWFAMVFHWSICVGLLCSYLLENVIISHRGFLLLGVFAYKIMSYINKPFLPPFHFGAFNHSSCIISMTKLPWQYWNEVVDVGIVDLFGVLRRKPSVFHH